MLVLVVVLELVDVVVVLVLVLVVVVLVLVVVVDVVKHVKALKNVIKLNKINNFFHNKKKNSLLKQNQQFSPIQ